MALYGKAAQIAAGFLANGQEVSPRAAWHRAVTQVFPPGSASIDKGCPRDAFLALCGAGAIKAVPAGTYTRSVKNRNYVERALSAVRQSPQLLNDQKQLWRVATNNSAIRPNYQLEVLTMLWSAGLVQDAL